MMKLNGIIVIPCALGLSFASPLLMRMYGAGYSHSWSTLIAAVWTAAIMGIITPVGDVIAASGRMWLGFVTNVGWAAVFVVTTVFLVHWGSLGLASSRLIAYAVHAIWTVAIGVKLINPGTPVVSSVASERVATEVNEASGPTER